MSPVSPARGTEAMIRRLSLLIIIVLAFRAAAAAQPAPPKVQATEYMVAMTDGVKLATDVYLPGDGKQAYPVILSRGPYGKSGARSFAEQACRRGYALVSQDIRGRGKSEGHHFIIFHNDGWSRPHEGQDTIAW